MKDVVNEVLVFSTVTKSLFSMSEIRVLVTRILTKLKVRGSVSIHCIGDTRMRSLNSHYRGKHSTTDVLTFPLREGEYIFDTDHELGDIFISIPQIIRQARRLSIQPREEFVRMLIHGVLHILGYDHVQAHEAKKMFSLQEKLLSELV